MTPTDQSPCAETGDLPVIAYIRVASADPDDQARSRERQRSEIALAADRLGLTISKEYTDLGYSGRTVDRPALRCLLNHVAAREVGSCIVASLDRLARDPLRYADLDEALTDAEVVIVDAAQHAGGPQR